LFWFILIVLLKKTLLENVLEKKEIRKEKEKKRGEAPGKPAHWFPSLGPASGPARPCVRLPLFSLAGE